MSACAWLGNVRELENSIRRAILLCQGDMIAEEHIVFDQTRDEGLLQTLERDQLVNQLRGKLETILPDILRLSSRHPHANIMEIVEETLIRSAMRECEGNQVRAARLLGISRNTLRHRLKKIANDSSAA